MESIQFGRGVNWQNFKMNNRTSEYVNSVFEQPWWLDTVAPNSWKEILIEEAGEVIARWPLV